MSEILHINLASAIGDLPSTTDEYESWFGDHHILLPGAPDDSHALSPRQALVVFAEARRIAPERAVIAMRDILRQTYLSGRPAAKDWNIVLELDGRSLAKSTLYITPAGFTCSCLTARAAAAGGQARRDAESHAELVHRTDGYTIVDYRQLVSSR